MATIDPRVQAAADRAAARVAGTSSAKRAFSDCIRRRLIEHREHAVLDLLAEVDATSESAIAAFFEEVALADRPGLFLRDCLRDLQRAGLVLVEDLNDDIWRVRVTLVGLRKQRQSPKFYVGMAKMVRAEMEGAS